jgi:hypothetical protein
MRYGDARFGTAETHTAPTPWSSMQMPKSRGAKARAMRAGTVIGDMGVLRRDREWRRTGR